jgi:outer membrane biosynthesis protein TonB
VRGFVIFAGLLLVLGGGAVAGAQFAPMDVTTLPELAPVFDNLTGSREFLKTDMALYAGGGAAGFGLLLMIIGAATGGKKRETPVAKSPEMPAPRRAEPTKTSVAPMPASEPPAEPPEPYQPPAAAPKPAPRVEPAPAVKAAAPQPVAAPTPAPTAPPPPKSVSPAPPPVAAATPPAAKPVISPAPALAPAPGAHKAKPQASAQPPAGAAQPAATAAPPLDPRMLNRKRVQDLVTINDALLAYYARNGTYPKAEGLAGANERGVAWIPGLSPEFLAQIPRDPLHSASTQYVYAAQGANYKLLALGVSLVGSGNVEVLGIKIDQTRNPTPQNAAFGFWTPAFAGV